MTSSGPRVPGRQARRLEVGAHGVDRLGAVVDEGGRGRAREQRLDAEGTGAGEQVEHRALDDDVEAAEGVEDRLAHPVRRRTGVRARRGLERAALRRAGHHASRDRIPAERAVVPRPPSPGA